MTAAAALAVGYYGGGGTAGSGHGSHRRPTGLRSRNFGRCGEQVTGAAGPGHGKGSKQGTWTRLLEWLAAGAQRM